VTNGVSEARQKGIRDSLVLVDGVALVVNVGSGMVITAVNNNSEKKLFSNIDGAVIV
jgi:flagellar operon protein